MMSAFRARAVATASGRDLRLDGHPGGVGGGDRRAAHDEDRGRVARRGHARLDDRDPLAYPAEDGPVLEHGLGGVLIVQGHGGLIGSQRQERGRETQPDQRCHRRVIVGGQERLRAGQPGGGQRRRDDRPVPGGGDARAEHGRAEAPPDRQHRGRQRPVLAAVHQDRCHRRVGGNQAAGHAGATG